ncbi:MAG: hypothetical protein ABIR24_08950 [Verrucomicrobiota bacterium]
MKLSLSVGQIPVLLRGDPDSISKWIQRWNTSQMLLYVAVIILGTGLYGAAMGLWRDPLQAVYTAIKFPLIILLTALGNALLNGMLALLLGLNIGFRQSLVAVLMSFTIAAVILGSFSPLMLFLVWNSPPISQQELSNSTHSFILLTQVVVIAFAGVVANLRLVQLLQRLSGSQPIARKILFAWLAGNLFLGSQLSWILRPFIGAPHLPIQFLRPNAFQGSFYETVFHALRNLFS